MKRFFTSSILASLIGFSAFGQLNVGDIAPDWTVTDINGNSHNLYSYLDQGYPVFFDISATWCGPCWSFHQSGAMKTLFENHGPAGMDGVSAETTNSIMVIFMEGDMNTGLNQLNGTGGNTQGNWVQGSPYPIVDLTNQTILQQYGLTGFPNCWLVCPDRKIKRFYAGYSASTMSATAILAEANGCPTASEGVDAGVMGYSGATVTCGSVDVVVAIQNQGTEPLTSATINVQVNGTNVITGFNWSGNLNTWEFENVNLGNITISNTSTITVQITTTDANPANNTLNQVVALATEATTQWDVYIKTDCWGSETTWAVKNEQGTNVATGGPYGNQQEYNVTFWLPSTGCYSFELYDSYGDGMFGSQWPQCTVNGACQVTTSLGTIYSYGMPGDPAVYDFSVDVAGANVTTVVSVEEAAMSPETSLNIFPNPFSGVTNLDYNLAETGRLNINVYNMLGEQVRGFDLGVQPAGSNRIELDLSDLTAGVYFVHMTSNNQVITKKITLTK